MPVIYKPKDVFGFEIGTKKSEACALYAQGKRPLDVEYALDGRQMNVLYEVAERGHLVVVDFHTNTDVINETEFRIFPNTQRRALRSVFSSKKIKISHAKSIGCKITEINMAPIAELPRMAIARLKEQLYYAELYDLSSMQLVNGIAELKTMRAGTMNYRKRTLSWRWQPMPKEFYTERNINPATFRYWIPLSGLGLMVEPD